MAVDAAVSGCPLGRPVLSHRGDLRRTAGRLRAGGTLRVLALGSSTTAGVGASSLERAYPERLEAELAALVPGARVEVEASGVSGEKADGTLARLRREASGMRPDLVVWQVGTNDALTLGAGEADFRATLTEGVAAARSAGADILLLDQQFFPGIADRPRYERFVAIVKETGRASGVSVVHRYALMKAWSERSREELRALLWTDLFHMSDPGHACVARLIAEHVAAAAREAEPVRGAEPVLERSAAGR